MVISRPGATQYPIYEKYDLVDSNFEELASARVSGSMTWNGDFEIGDFLNYSYSASSGDGYKLYVVSNISSTNMTINVTINGIIEEPLIVPLNTSIAFGLGPDFNNYPFLENDWIHDGDELVETAWGSLLCQRLNYTNSMSSDIIWVYDGVMIKEEMTSEWISAEIILVDTNLEEIISG
jgi:hypothetical protein